MESTAHELRRRTSAKGVDGWLYRLEYEASADERVSVGSRRSPRLFPFYEHTHARSLAIALALALVDAIVPARSLWFILSFSLVN